MTPSSSSTKATSDERCTSERKRSSERAERVARADQLGDVASDVEMPMTRPSSRRAARRSYDHVDQRAVLCRRRGEQVVDRGAVRHAPRRELLGSRR